MKKVALFLLFFLLNLGAFGVVEAQNKTFSQETILSFSSYITVNTDNSVDVKETIIYNTGPQEHRGIYRDIRPYSSQNRKMEIENIDITDEIGNSYPFETSNSGGNFRIKIGDSSQTFNGQKTYIIKYHATKAVAQLEKIDEIYWNVTGNEWDMPINEVQASVVLPEGVISVQSACYFGPKGSNNQCQPANEVGRTYMFYVPLALNKGDGLTVAVGFQKGVIGPYLSSDAPLGFFDKYWRWFVAVALLILTLIFSLLYWHKKSRDPKGTGVVIPQYDVPDELTPAEVGGIVNGKVNAKYISAEIIYLATKGYLKINQLEKRFIGIIKFNDYELVKLKDFSDLLNDFDQKLMAAIFDTHESIKISDLKNVFYKKVSKITASVSESLFKKGYYENLDRLRNDKSRIASFLSVIVYGIISRFYPAKTEKGVSTKEHLLGLKDYLQIAEKDRLLFHNAPDKKPEIFERLLPYAMVLGVANIWAKEFEGIYVIPPSWYSGPANTAFSAVAFNDSIYDFSSHVSSSMVSSSGGSGGGGFSGGGGGGGGGGSW